VIKRIVSGLSLVVLFVFLASSVAYASTSSGYIANPVGSNPHGGYVVASKKCAVCHAVHKANAAGSEILLRSSRADACTYCHIDPGVSSKIVYGGVSTNYSGTDNPYGHNYSLATPVTCTLCHQVHAAESQMTSNTILTNYILVRARTAADDPPGAGYDQDSDWDTEGAPLAGDSKDVAISKWCTRCHTYWPGTAPDPIDSHVLKAADGTHSFSGSQYCVSCHNSNTVGGVVTTGSAFPHFTDGVRFLTQAGGDVGGSVGAVPATDSQHDGVCLRCHRDGLGQGVGDTF
jgi:predicted CXXCH cytochrome family protein